MAIRLSPSSRSNAELIEIYRAARFRFRKAFPELAQFFPWLMEGTSRGIAWTPLLHNYVEEIGPRRTRSLIGETHDVTTMGITRQSDFDYLACDLLDLDRMWLAEHGKSAESFLRELDARFAHRTRPE